MVPPAVLRAAADNIGYSIEATPWRNVLLRYATFVNATLQLRHDPTSSLEVAELAHACCLNAIRH